MPATPTDIIRALSTIVEPAREKDIITLNMVRDLKVTDDRVSMTLMVKDPTAPFSDEIEGLVKLSRVGPTAAPRRNAQIGMLYPK